MSFGGQVVPKFVAIPWTKAQLEDIDRFRQYAPVLKVVAGRYAFIGSQKAGEKPGRLLIDIEEGSLMVAVPSGGQLDAGLTRQAL